MPEASAHLLLQRGPRYRGVRDDAAAALSFRNLPTVQIIGPGELNAYDVLCNDWVIFTKDVLPAGTPTAPEASTDEKAAS